MYRIEYAESIAGDLASLRAYDRKQILGQLEEQLKYEPTKKTRNRKPLPDLIPPREYIEPVWELRLGNIVSSTMWMKRPPSSRFVRFVTNRRIKRQRKSYEDRWA